MEKTGAWRIKEVKAIYLDDEGTPHSYWPQLYPLAKLGSICKLIGSRSFALMFMNDVTNLSGEYFEIEWLRNALPEELPKFKHLYISCDLATTAKQRSDHSAIATIGVDKDSRFYLLDLVFGKFKPEDAVEEMEKAWQKASVQHEVLPTLLIETVGGQVLYVTLLDKSNIIPQRCILQTKPITDKLARAQSSIAACQRKDIFFCTDNPIYPRLVSQFLDFTGLPGNQDDMVDVVTQVVDRHAGSYKLATKSGAKLLLKKIPGLR